MKRFMNVFASLLGLLFLIVLAFVLIFAYRTLPGGPEPPPAAPQPPADTSEPSVTPSLPEPPPTGPVGAYPAPGETTEAPAPPVGPTSEPLVLPPLPTYPPSGPFREMRVLYSNSREPGYRSIAADGTNEIMLESWGSEPRSQFNAAGLLMAPDGHKFLYTYWNNLDQRQAAIWTMNPDGSEKQLLVGAKDEWFPEDAIWSPGSQQIAYRRAYLGGSYDEGAPTSSRELWIMNADGSNQRQVLKDAAFYDIDGAGGTSTIFRWLKNGYIYFATHSRQLYAVSPEDGQLYKIIDNVDPLDVRRYLSPDGQYLVTSPALSAQAIEQSGLVPMEVPGIFGGWSADGNSLIYQMFSGTSQAAGIWVREVTTGQERLLTSEEVPINHGLSPDGQYLAYQTNAGLFVLEVATSSSHMIVSDPHDPVNGSAAIRFLGWIPVP